ncbi:MAG: hypothetical protein JSS79_15070 [Bacteroidetes bacterium]|nr:hypothetical protein [Bacteroidota bacterium]
MKRFIAFAGIFLIACSAVEYYALIFMAQRQLTEEVLQRIEANSDELGGNLILTIPLEYPYAAATEEYTRVDGQFVYQGENYRMVKQKFYRNILYVVCIREALEEDTPAAIADFSKLFSGEHADRANTSFKMINAFAKDYFSKQLSFSPRVPGHCNTLTPAWVNRYRFTFRATLLRPPQFS